VEGVEGGGFIPPRVSGVTTPGKLMNISGQDPAFWFVLGKKMCSCHGLLGIRDIV